jgi:hypothetical protein
MCAKEKKTFREFDVSMWVSKSLPYLLAVSVMTHDE